MKKKIISLFGSHTTKNNRELGKKINIKNLGVCTGVPKKNFSIELVGNWLLPLVFYQFFP